MLKAIIIKKGWIKMIIIAAIVAVILNVIYHKVFGVIYFSFGAIIKEWFVCFVIALVIVGALFA
mgnify:FL=1